MHFTLNTAVVAAKGCARRAVRHLNVMLLQAGGHVLQEGLIMSEDIAEHCWNYGQRMEPRGGNEPVSGLRLITHTGWALV